MTGIILKAFIFLKIYLFIHDKQRERVRERETQREAETQEEGEAGSMPGARRGTQFRDSKIAPWAKGRRQTSEPPRDPLHLCFYPSSQCLSSGLHLTSCGRDSQMV